MGMAGIIQFEVAEVPITERITKFGGQPVWLGAPQWPISRKTGNPMRFICQIALEEPFFSGTSGRMAYVFMTEEDSDDFVDGTYDADGGENAVIVQPGATEVAVDTKPNATGPTLFRKVGRDGDSQLHSEGCEYGVTLLGGDDESLTADGLAQNMIGGEPVFVQDDGYPEGGPWHLLLQLDSANVPFYVNFGDAGVGYGFLHANGDCGKFLWQCG
jgi:hypothetical protein